MGDEVDGIRVGDRVMFKPGHARWHERARRTGWPDCNWDHPGTADGTVVGFELAWAKVLLDETKEIELADVRNLRLTAEQRRIVDEGGE